MKKSLLLILLAMSISLAKSARKMIYCRYNFQSFYRSDEFSFEPENIDPKLCTHLGFGIFNITQNGELETKSSHLKDQFGLIKRTVALKKKNTKLKILAIVRVSYDGLDNNKRTSFVYTSANFISQNGIHGLDLNIVLPPEIDVMVLRNPYETLMKELQKKFKSQDLLLGISISGLTDHARLFASWVHSYVAFINIMAYNYAREDTLSFDAPLSSESGRIGGPGGISDVSTCVDYWLRIGAPADKLNLGISLLGLVYRTDNALVKHADATGILIEKWHFSQICTQRKHFTESFDEAQSVPYMANASTWISFENARSIEMKVELAINANLKGIMIADIDDDDFRGMCGERYHLIKFAKRKLQRRYDTINGISCLRGDAFLNRCFKEY
ncbi:chitinase-3-like protein 1 [Haematobia irritans]|uniref:chitinase-3-like protein 1 n=1 Tax=Haematobia irritans TaxID=7368 RepID=UPI003F4FDFDB